MRTFRPGDEYDLVDVFAADLQLENWYGWLPDEAFSAAPQRAPQIESPREGGPTNPELLQEPALQMAATMYMLGALRRFAKMEQTEVHQIVGEIALVGLKGLDYASSERSYTLRFLPGEEFTGLQLICMMHVGFKQIEPSLDTGIPLDDAYRNALALYEAGG